MMLSPQHRVRITQLSAIIEYNFIRTENREQQRRDKKTLANCSAKMSKNMPCTISESTDLVIDSNDTSFGALHLFVLFCIAFVLCFFYLCFFAPAEWQTYLRLTQSQSRHAFTGKIYFVFAWRFVFGKKTLQNRLVSKNNQANILDSIWIIFD